MASCRPRSPCGRRELGARRGLGRQLRGGRFALGAIDCQVTASVDGSYFKAHTDAGANETYKRQFTYVYYFNREPKGFTGGELGSHEHTVPNREPPAPATFPSIEARHHSRHLVP